MSAVTPPPTDQHVAEQEVPVAHASAVEAFFANLTDAQSRFVRTVADATTWLDDADVDLAQYAALHARLTQQIFDAQRAILRKRADSDAAALRVGRSAEAEAQRLVDDALAEAAVLCADLEEVTAFGDVLAMRRDGREPSPPALIENVEPDTDRRVEATERQLQGLLDDWWSAEVERANTRLDEAQARAAVCLHLARIEAGEILEAARAVSAAAIVDDSRPATDDDDNGPAATGEDLESHPSPSPSQLSSPVPLLPSASAPPVLVELDAVLDVADPVGLEALLASLLDALRDPPADVTTSDADATDGEASNADVSAGHSETAVAAAPQDAFDRFWSAGHARVRRGTREWFLMQVMLPMVAVVAVLALVLAWIG